MGKKEKKPDPVAEANCEQLAQIIVDTVHNIHHISILPQSDKWRDSQRTLALMLNNVEDLYFASPTCDVDELIALITEHLNECPECRSFVVKQE